MRNTPKFFWVAAILSLLWTLMGDAAYFSQVTMDTSPGSGIDPYDAKLFREMPGWVWSAYAIAVWSATLGAIGLLLRRVFAVPLYFLSMIAVIVQFSYSFGATDLLAVKGPSTLAFPAMIFLMAVAQYWFARSMAVRGVLR